MAERGPCLTLEFRDDALSQQLAQFDPPFALPPSHFGFGVCSSQSRSPPRNALALSPARHRGGSAFSFFTLPPPRTTSSGSRAAIRRAATSATYWRHFFLPTRSNPRMPT